MLRAALRAADPTAMATLVSSLVAATARIDPEGDSATLDQLVESLAGTSYAETTAALHVIAALLADELEAARIRRVLAGRRHPMPDHVVGVADVSVSRAARMGDELGDGDNVILGLEWPGTRGVTAVVYVDEAFGTRVKDVFLVPEPFDTVCGWYRDALVEQGRDRHEVAEISTADARATLLDAVATGDAPDAPLTPEAWSGPDGEDLGWPAARAFVDMLLRRMPEGGTSVLTSMGYPSMSAGEAAERFLASRHVTDDDDLEDLDVDGAAHLLALDAEAGAGHPLRWSPTQVELALTQRLPWSLAAGEPALESVPAVLPDFVRFAHEEMAITPAATAETLAAVDDWMPTFERLMVASSAARWREVGHLVEAFESGDHAPLLLHSLAEEVGGREALDSLEADPLPSGRPAVDAVEEDAREPLAEIMALVDGWFDGSSRLEDAATLGAEWRTATHRLLVWSAERDPGWLRRRADPRGRAAGAIWATGIANRLVGPQGLVLVKDLAADLGVRGALASKAEALLRAWGVPAWEVFADLGDPRLLVSTRRAEIIALRDRWHD